MERLAPAKLSLHTAANPLRTHYEALETTRGPLDMPQPAPTYASWLMGHLPTSAGEEQVVAEDDDAEQGVAAKDRGEHMRHDSRPVIRIDDRLLAIAQQHDPSLALCVHGAPAGESSSERRLARV